MTPLAILLERADAALLAHGAAARDALIRQIEAAIREGENPARVRDLDHVLQLVEFRERTPAPQEMAPPETLPERIVRWTDEAEGNAGQVRTSAGERRLSDFPETSPARGRRDGGQG